MKTQTAALALRMTPSPVASSVSRFVTMKGGVTMPAIMYGTAWKKDQTAELVCAALAAGYTAFDTAASKKHYNEAGTSPAPPREKKKKKIQSRNSITFDITGVGDALRRCGGSATVFRQTKFTYLRGHNKGERRVLLAHHIISERSTKRGGGPRARAPGEAPWADEEDATRRVEASFQKSLESLGGSSSVDALLLHGPSTDARRTGTLTQEDVVTWAAIRSLHELVPAPGFFVLLSSRSRWRSLNSAQKKKERLVEERERHESVRSSSPREDKKGRKESRQHTRTRFLPKGAAPRARSACATPT